MSTRTPTSLEYIPFPTPELPEPLRSFVSGTAKALGCDDAFVAVPLLAICAAAIGNSRRIKLKGTWYEPAILWTGIVSDSGTMKSPASDAAMEVIHHLQTASLRAYEEQMKAFEIEVLEYEKALSSWKRGEAGCAPPVKPTEPFARRYYCGDTTVEALGGILLQNLRGLLLYRDELSGWFGSFDQYKAGSGGDAAHWLEMHGGRTMVIDRKTGQKKIICVPRASVSITGGIQPGVLKRCLSREHFEDGLAARMLLAAPPRRIKQWTDDEVPAELRSALRAAVENLYAFKPAINESGDPEPVTVELTPDAKKDWVSFYNAHGVEQAGLTGDLASAWSKLEAYAARLALILHLVRLANAEPGVGARVDRVSMRSAIALVRWFKHEQKRIYAMLLDSKGGPEIENLRKAEKIAQHGGRVTVRDWQRITKANSAKDAERELDALVKAGIGRWENPPTGPKGGHPTRVFVLNLDAETEPPGTSDSTPAGSGATGVPSASPVSRGSGQSQEERVVEEGVMGSSGGSADPPGDTPRSPCMVDSASTEIATGDSSDNGDADTTHLTTPPEGVPSPVSEDVSLVWREV